MDSEEPVFEAVLNWVKHNRKEREPYLPDMLEFVRMPLLTPRYITDVIDAEVNPATQHSPSLPPLLLLLKPFPSYFKPLIRCSLPCRDLVDEAKKFHLRPELRSEMQGPRTQARLGQSWFHLAHTCLCFYFKSVPPDLGKIRSLERNFFG